MCSYSSSKTLSWWQCCCNISLSAGLWDSVVFIAVSSSSDRTIWVAYVQMLFFVLFCFVLKKKKVELKSEKRAEFVQSPFIDAEGSGPLGLSNLPSDKIRGGFETETDKEGASSGCRQKPFVWSRTMVEFFGHHWNVSMCESHLHGCTLKERDKVVPCISSNWFLRDTSSVRSLYNKSLAEAV